MSQCGEGAAGKEGAVFFLEVPPIMPVLWLSVGEDVLQLLMGEKLLFEREHATRCADEKGVPRAMRLTLCVSLKYWPATRISPALRHGLEHWEKQRFYQHRTGNPNVGHHSRIPLLNSPGVHGAKCRTPVTRSRGKHLKVCFRHHGWFLLF